MSRERRGDRLQLAAEAALALVTVAAVIGMHRLFVDGSYRGPLLAQLVLAHLVVTAVRRAGWGLGAAAAATFGGAVVATTWLHAVGTTFALLPTPDTANALRAELSASWQTFSEVRAPAPVEDGFLVAAGGAIWVVALVADWAAFRTRVVFEAIMPAGTLFLFAAVLGGDGGFVAGAAVFAAAALLFALVHRTWGQERAATWAGHHRAHGRWSLITTGATLGGVAVLVGAALGPNLPIADGAPVWAVRDLSVEDDTRVVVSPMVEMRTRLVEQPDVEVFTVRSEEPAYWRLTALDEFDGDIWRSSYGTSSAEGTLERSTEPAAAATTVTQRFTIGALGAVWLPAAFEPVAVDAGDHGVDWDDDSATLIVDRAASSSDGFSYEVRSEVPHWTTDQLRRATGEVPDDIAERYLALPELDPAVGALADRLTAGAASPYDAAMALQDHLRSFTYDRDVGPGHSADALTSFLFETRRGYCEQFAGAFAALARSAGLPARVAVGFTKGIQDPNDPTLFRVRGQHAHAWAEVYLAGVGWVTFDPTPTRGPPGAQDWLGFPEQQVAADGDGTTATTAPGTSPAARDDRAADATATGESRRPADTGRADLDAAAGGRTGDEPGLLDQAGRIALPVGVGLLGYVVLVPLLLATQGWLRRRRASKPEDRVRLGWQVASDQARAVGADLPLSLTLAERAMAIGDVMPPAAPEVHALARTLERAAYAERPPTDDEVAAAVAAERVAVAEARRRMPWRRRVVRALDARRLRGTPGDGPTRRRTEVRRG